MASSGKKGKKTKGKTLALTDFLQETPGATPTIPIRKTNLNWADEVEDICDQYDSRPKANVVLPTAPKASRGLDEYTEKIPHQPPYIAYLSNLPYDVNEDEIAEFFGDLKITSMRIPKEDRPGEAPRLKGFGYVEFDDRESLVGALSITDCTLKNRRIRIEIATNLDNDRRRGRMDNNRDRSDRGETSGDWRSGPRAEPTEPDRRDRGGGGGFNRDRDRDGGGGFEKDRGSWRDANDRPSFRDSERDNRGFNRDSDRGGSGYRDGFGDRSRFSDRDGEKRSFAPRRNDRDDRDFTRGGGRDEMGSERSEPRMRPKLVLAPRSKPVDLAVHNEPDKEIPQESVPVSVPASASSIFGSAKPVDTSIRERQIEDRLAKEYERPTSETSRDSRRDTDRRDWGGRKEDDDSKWPQSRRRDSPRRNSPRRNSPRRHSPRRTSPPRHSPRGTSPRKHSPPRSSPDNRRDHSPNYTRNSYSRRRDSSEDRRGSQDRSVSPEYRRSSPDHRTSPDRGMALLDRGRGSPDRKWGSGEHRRVSPVRKYSPDRKNTSPDLQKAPPEYKRASPEPRRSPDRSQLNRTSIQHDKDRRGPSKNERPVLKTDKEKHKREEKLPRDAHEMPKLKEPEPPNFAASNKYAYLKAEDDSD